MTHKLLEAPLIAKIGWYLMFFAGCALFLFGVYLFSPRVSAIVAGLLLAVMGFFGGLDPMRDWGSEA